jgi:phospholipase/carboxylesterase
MHRYQIMERGKPVEKAKKALILLHGRGGTASDILSLADLFCDETFYIAAPQATNHTWYANSFMAEESSNEPWLSSAVAIVQRLIDETSKHIPKDQIYIMGFSQGACLALETTARFASKYGGVIAFTGGLIGSVIHPEKYQGHFEGTQVFIGTSANDPHIPLERAEESKTLMEKLGAHVTLKVYPGRSHTITEAEISTVKKLFHFSV